MTEARRWGAGTAGSSRFRDTSLPVQAWVAVSVVAACGLPFVASGGPGERRSAWVTVAVLVAVSVLNVEIGRRLYGGLAHTQQPHKALSAWAFSCAMLLSAPWLLVVVPFTYAHARWRGLRIPLWKWVGSAAFLVVAGVAAGTVTRLVVGTQPNWMVGSGGRGLAALALAAVVFLAVESLMLAASALLGDPEDEAWLRRTLTDPSFYLTELGVLAVASLLVGVWTGGPWFVLLLVPLYAVAQRAALLQPVRERAETAARLAVQNEELEQANRFKVDLVGMLGHEVGNPLTSILGYGQVGFEALETGDLALARRCFDVVERNALQIERVCADILALARSDRGELTARPQRCPLRAPLLAAAAAQPPDRQPVVECPDDLAALVQPDHLDQVLANLLGNAAKYAGGATRLAATTEPGGRVSVSVADEGPGVPADFRDRLFDRFSRDSGSEPLARGTGLGLFITRSLARANGGEIRHADADPHGAVFTLVLPRAGAEQLTRSAQATGEVTGRST